MLAEEHSPDEYTDHVYRYETSSGLTVYVDANVWSFYDQLAQTLTWSDPYEQRSDYCDCHSEISFLPTCNIPLTELQYLHYSYQIPPQSNCDGEDFPLWLDWTSPYVLSFTSTR